MKGKILGPGAISGEDGNRYYYDEGELQNAKANEKLEGLSVDFEIKEGRAVGIFIIRGSNFASFNANIQNINLPSYNNKWVFWDLNAAKENLLAPNIHSIKFFALLSILIGFINYLIYSPVFDGAGFIFLYFLTIVIWFWLQYCICLLNKSYTLLKYYIFSALGSILFYFLVKSMIQDALVLALSKDIPWFRGILAVVCLGVSIFYLVLYVKFLSKITEESFFMLAFILTILSLCFNVAELIRLYNNMANLQLLGLSHSTFYYIALILAIAGNALFVLAWLRFKNIQNSKA